MFDPATIAIIAAVGLAAGVLGGMLGIGGSVLMIPAMVILFGQGTKDPGFNQHLYQAAAMITNVFVIAPATYRHARAGAVRTDVLKRLMPIAAVFIFVGVLVSTLPVFDPEAEVLGASGPTWLGRLFAAFLAYVIILNTVRFFRGRREVKGDERLDTWRIASVGVVMGFVAGLLGIGGGALAVPMQQVLLRLPLRQCIANSAAVICLTASVGAVAKNLALPPACDAVDAIKLAGLLAPTAINGGYLGGALTHKLPVPAVRAIFIALMATAGWQMAFA